MEKRSHSTIPSYWMQNCLCVLLALVPLVYSAKGVDPILVPRQTFLSLLVLLFACWFVFKLKKTIAIQSAMPILFVLLGILYWLSTFQAINHIESCYIALKIAVFVAYFLVLYVGFKEQIFTIQLISKGIAISGLVAVGLAIRDMVFLQTHGVNIFNDGNMYKVNATFGHKNLLSAYLFLCSPMVVVQLLFVTKRIWKVFFSLGFLVMIVVMVMLQTRAVLLAGLICFGIAVALAVRSKTLSAAQRKIGILFLSVFLILAATAGYVYRDKFDNITRTESFIERKHVWENTWQMIIENPVAGVGAANWQIHFPKYGMQKFYEVNYTITEGLTNFQRPHNDFLWVWAETGLFGFIVYGLIFIVGCWYAYTLFKGGHDTRTQLLYGLVLLQLIGFIIISLVDFPLERIEHPMVILTSIAFIAAVSPSALVKIQLPKWTLLVLVVVGAYSVFICNKRWYSELQLRKMYKTHAAGNWEKLIEEGKKARTPYFNMDYFSIPVDWYIGVGYFMQSNLPLAKEYFEQAYRLHPYQIHVLNNYGACYEKEGNHDKAIELLETAHRISPTFSDGIINLSGAYFNVGRYDDAFNTITTIGYDEDNPRLKVFVLAIVKKKIGAIVDKQPRSPYATFLKGLMSNDNAILGSFKEAKERHLFLMDFLQKKFQETGVISSR